MSVTITIRRQQQWLTLKNALARPVASTTNGMSVGKANCEKGKTYARLCARSASWTACTFRTPVSPSLPSSSAPSSRRTHVEAGSWSAPACRSSEDAGECGLNGCALRVESVMGSVVVSGRRWERRWESVGRGVGVGVGDVVVVEGGGAVVGGAGKCERVRLGGKSGGFRDCLREKGQRPHIAGQKGKRTLVQELPGAPIPRCPCLRQEPLLQATTKVLRVSLHLPVQA
jgi:hypothetical protein